MKWLSYFLLYTFASALPKNKVLSTTGNDETIFSEEVDNASGHQVDTNTTCNTNLPGTTEELLNKLLVFLKHVVEHGDEELGIPVLEPLEFDNYILVIPSALVFLNLSLRDITATGFSNFIIHESKLDIKSLTFDIAVEFPNLHIVSDEYNLLGYLYSVIPFYGKGRAEFHIERFRFGMKLHLEQSEDKKSVLIKNVENASYIVPFMKPHLNGVLGGGDIDAIVNALIDEVVLGYINRFYGKIAILVSQAAMAVGNPILHQLHTWCYIDALHY